MMQNKRTTPLFQKLWLNRLEDRTVPATFTVNSLADFGLGTLRAGVDACNSTPGADIINFDSSLFGTIKLTSGQINITQPLQIIGPGGGLIAVSGNNSSRIFDTLGAPAGTAITIAGLTLTAGKPTSGSGGAIRCGNQHLNLTDCLFSNNTSPDSGGALNVNTGDVNITNCRFLNNVAATTGGAVSLVNAQKSSAFYSEFTGNTGISGGAMYLDGETFLFGCTLSANVAAATNGGGIIWDANNELKLVSCTISNNTAKADGGGIHAIDGPSTLDIDNCTLTANTATTGDGGGIRRTSVAGPTQIDGSIVSGNSAGGVGPDIASSAAISANHNAIGNPVGFSMSGANNLAFGTDLKLGPLANNAGSTRTHRPADDSPLIDAAPNAIGVQYDQRGVTRVIGSAADIGSVEVPTSLIVTNDKNSGAGSLRQVVNDANLDPVAHVVTFDFNYFYTPRTITLTSGEIPITANIEIYGPSLANVYVDGNNAYRIFNMNLPALVVGELYLSGMTLIHAKSLEDGGAILSNRPVTLFGCGLTQNTAIGDGAAVWAPSVTADYSIFTSNTATANGGAISTNALDANDCVFQNNLAQVRGGAIDAYNAFGGHATLRRCNVWSNAAPTAGGLYVETTLTLEQSTVAYNKATSGRGGGINLTNANTSPSLIRNSTVSSNTAAADGAGVGLVNFNTTLNVLNSTVTANQATNLGGGIARISGTGTITLVSCIVSKNLNATAPDLFTSGTVDCKFSLVGSKTGVATFNADATTNALLGVDGKLGPLAHNGGPTFTHLLLSGSPARDQGSNPSPAATFDQRGALRTWGAGIDIGALEVQTDTTFVVDILADETDGIVAKGDFSLREALEVAGAALESFDIVTFDPVVFAGTKTINLIYGQLPVTGPVDVQGTGASRLTVNGNNQGRVFHLYAAPAGTDIIISDLTVANGKTYGVGGGLVMSAQDLTLNRCVFVGNGSIDKYGGAVAQDGGTLTAIDCTFTGNTAAGYGGAIASAGQLNLRNCTLSNNSVSGNGGAIHLTGNGTKGFLSNCTLSGNSANLYGGAIALVDNPMAFVVTNSTITANVSLGLQGGQGGGIARVSGSGSINIDSSIVAGNTNSLAPDIYSSGLVNVNYSAVGNSQGFTLTGANNLAFGIDLKLGPLAANGGPTQTHALLPDSPGREAGSNSAGLSYDQRGLGFARQVGGKTDIGSFELQIPPAPPTATIKVDDGTAQRSNVASFTVTFSDAVTFPMGLVAAFQLVRLGPGVPAGPVIVVPTQVANTVTLHFNDPVMAAVNGSLIDGNYELTLVANNIAGAGGLLDGDGNGIGGDDQTLLIHRLFGDVDGDADVDSTDFGMFRTAFGGMSTIFDFDGDGDVDTSDYGQFRQRFGSTI